LIRAAAAAGRRARHRHAPAASPAGTLCAVHDGPDIRGVDSHEWVSLDAAPLPIAEATAWATTPDSGAVVVFLGVARDHSEGRGGVTGLTYEAYETAAAQRMGEIAAETRRRWPAVSRLALLHRLGHLPLSEASVAVVVSAPHRADAFEAARFAIDTLKETVPIWKREHWAGGDDWATCAHEVRPVRTEPANVDR
jgi:molybdopterin synthase catalytic subunit